MKKILPLIFVALLPLVANADAVEIDGIYYNFNGDEAEVTYHPYATGDEEGAYSGSIVIPAAVTYEGKTYAVTNIGNWAFNSCTELTEITIPNSVTSIGYSAFGICTKLESVTIPNSVTSIGDIAFANCYGLTSVTIPGSVTSIGEATFESCHKLTSATIGSGVKSIGLGAFCDCSSLPRITIPESVTYIGESAFAGCNSLPSVTIPKNVMDIGKHAFSACEKLTTVTIESNAIASVDRIYDSIPKMKEIFGEQVKRYNFGDAVTRIGAYAFSRSYNTSQFSFGSGLRSIGEYALDDTDWYYQKPDGLVYAGYVAYKYKEDNNDMPEGTKIVLKDETVGIADCAFDECEGLIFIYIPNNVTSIGYAAFRCCYSLSSINIPNSVTYIGSEAFSFCTSLTSITLPTGVTSIGDSTFDGCESLTSVYIQESVTSIGESAFFGCVSLTSINIPNSVTSIGTCAFNNCSSLTSVTIPESVTSIGDEAFNECESLTTVTLESDAIVSATEIYAENYGGYYNRPMAILFGNQVETYILGDAVTSIGDEAFEGCTSLTFINIPEGVISIGDYAFCGCESLTSINIPEGVTSIGDEAFSGCESLTSINIPQGVTSIGVNALEGSEGMIINIADLSAWCNIEFGGYQHMYHLYFNNEEITNLIIPNDVTHIADWSFSGYENLFSIIIPESVTSIGIGTFCGCDGLTSVTISNGVTSIGEDSFYGCDNLTYIVIPESVTSIGEYAFGGCENLTSVKVKMEEPVAIYYDTFSNRRNATLYVPAGCVSAYENAEYWKDFRTIKESQPEVNGIFYRFDNEGMVAWVTIPDIIGQYNGDVTIPSTVIYDDQTYSVIGIDPEAFAGCESLTSITIPRSVTSIGEGAFYECRNLTDVTIPESVTSIGSGAFIECENLTTVTLESDAVVSASRSYDYAIPPMEDIFGEQVQTYILGDAVTSIGNYAFISCENLTSIIIPKSVTSIGYAAFADCESLNSINIPESVTSIGSYAFAGCESLTDVIIPESVISIGEEGFPFESTPWYDNQEGLIYVGKVLYAYKGEMLEDTEITIKDGTVRIASYAFNRCGNCENLTSVNIPESVTSIGQYAFGETAWFENQPDGLVYAGKVAYEYKQYESEMPEDTKIELKDGTKGIADYAFSNCYRLTSIKIPESVTCIGNYAFAWCESLTDVYCYATVPPTASYYNSENEENEYAFDIDYIWEYTTLHVPEGSVEAYGTTEPWNCFRFITDGVTIIDAIEDVEAKDAKEMDYYDLNGCKLDTPQKGINIIRYSDGTTKKVLMK